MNRVEKILLYSSDLWYLGEGMLGPLFAIFAQRVGGSIFDLTWAWGAYLVAAGANTILIGKLSDEKLSKSKLMVLGYWLNALFTFAYIFVGGPLSLFLVQVGLGFAAALATPTWQALYAKYQNKNKSGTVWGLFSGESKIISGLAVILGGFVINHLSFVWLFVLMGIVQTLAALYQSKIFSFTKE